MKVKVIADECEVKVSPISTRKYPKGWVGEMPDDIAVQGILAGAVEDPTGELTREAIEAEILRREAIIAAGGDPDAPEHQPQSEPEPKPAKRARAKKKTV